jgi:hypothetical protein
VISPSGRPSVVEWPVEIRRTPPDLDLEARTTLFSFEATLEGRVTPPATVEVDGRTAVIDRDGRFSMSVGAGVWPRGIEVEARDPFGNVQRGRIDVVGLVDYRVWPWLPITVISTLLIGAVLSVRLPARGQRDLLDDEAGSLEEIGGDPG